MSRLRLGFIPVTASCLALLVAWPCQAQELSENCMSLIQPKPNETTEELSTRGAALHQCIADAQQAKAKSIPPLGSTGSCPRNLSYLDSRLPRYPSDAEYTKIRSIGVGTDIVEALGTARSQGLSVADAADQLLQQVKVAEGVEHGMADVARAYNNAGDATLVQLRNGTYPASGTLPPAFQGYLAAYVGMVVSREAAAAIVCVARQQGK